MDVDNPGTALVLSSKSHNAEEHEYSTFLVSSASTRLTELANDFERIRDLAVSSGIMDAPGPLGLHFGQGDETAVDHGSVLRAVRFPSGAVAESGAIAESGGDLEIVEKLEAQNRELRDGVALLMEVLLKQGTVVEGLRGRLVEPGSAGVGSGRGVEMEDWLRWKRDLTKVLDSMPSPPPPVVLVPAVAEDEA
ncbi:hypothetical protein BC829DRAFT_417864 [Chytridium lagenaria]|nr:hypothetical protein BC829DRAFT_417864 [Chytridium lagenaria]